MEADWEIEIAPEAPVIDASWPGFIDLKLTPERIDEIEEATRFPGLADILLRLNKNDSPAWTAKCDIWRADPVSDLWDRDEMEAAFAEFTAGVACYLDILPIDPQLFEELKATEAWARATVSRMRQSASRCSRVDLVIRRAFHAEKPGFAVTAYALACGRDENAAENALTAALNALVRAIMANEQSA
jgi:hypothetical protein